MTVGRKVLVPYSSQVLVLHTVQVLCNLLVPAHCSTPLCGWNWDWNWNWNFRRANKIQLEFGNADEPIKDSSEIMAIGTLGSPPSISSLRTPLDGGGGDGGGGDGGGGEAVSE